MGSRNLLGPPWRVVVISPSLAVRRELADKLSDHAARIRAYCSADHQTGHHPHGPDLVLYDLCGLHQNVGPGLADVARRSVAGVLALAYDPRPDLSIRALDLGARDVVPLDLDSTDLVAAIEATIASPSTPPTTKTQPDPSLR